MKASLVAETKTMLFLFVYLSLFLGAFTMYRRLVLAEYGIGYFQYGYTFFEALVLSKVIALGRYLRLGERFRGHPLIIPTLYKTLLFSLFVFAFSILEHLISGWLHDKATSVIIDEFLDLGLPEILARTLVKMVALLPLFAVWEIGRVLGDGRLFELFFTSGARGNTELTSGATPVCRDDVSEHAGRPAI